MKKYYIGLSILAGITVALFIYILTMGMAGKNDKVTYNKAVDMSEKLNAYVNTNSKIPESLDEVGIKDVPSSISYTKKDSKSYEFCVTYKNDRKGGSSTSPAILLSPLTAASQISGATSNAEFYKTFYSSSPQSYLYLDYYYSAGKNCKTVTPYMYDSSNYDSSSSSVSDSTYSSTSKEVCSTAYSWGGNLTDYFYSLDESKKQISYSYYSTASASNATYNYTASTKFVDSDCGTISVTSLKKGDSYTVYYDNAGKIVVLKTKK